MGCAPSLDAAKHKREFWYLAPKYLERLDIEMLLAACGCNEEKCAFNGVMNVNHSIARGDTAVFQWCVIRNDETVLKEAENRLWFDVNQISDTNPFYGTLWLIQQHHRMQQMIAIHLSVLDLVRWGKESGISYA